MSGTGFRGIVAPGLWYNNGIARRSFRSRFMQAFEGIYENGVVRFTSPVSIPEHAKVKVIAECESAEQASSGCNSPGLYEIMSRSYDTGQTDAAARVDEHQP